MSILSLPPSVLSFYTAQEPSPTSPTSTFSSDTDLELSHISQCTIPTLLGKSNFRKWHASIDPILLSNDQARSLILGTWFEPPSPRSSDTLSTTSPQSPISVSPISPSPTQPYSILHAPSLSHTSFTTHQTLLHAYERANLTMTRFIRGTLGMNVTPFVRQHTSAKGLYEQLIYLYGERAGIDMVGGPAMNIDMNMSVSLRSRRTTESSIRRISEHGDDISPMLQIVDTQASPLQNRRTTDESSLGYGSGMNTNSNTRRNPHNILPGNHSRQTPAQQPIPPKKKKVAFKFSNTFFHFSRSSRDKDNSDASPSSPSKTVLSPIQQSPASPDTLSHFHSHNHIRNPSACASPSTWVSRPLTPAAPSSYSTTHTPSTGSVSSSSSTSNTNPVSNTNPTPNQALTLGFSSTPGREASMAPSESEAGTQLEYEPHGRECEFPGPDGDERDRE